MIRPTKDLTRTAIPREQLLVLLQGDDAMRALVQTIVQEVLEAELEDSLLAEVIALTGEKHKSPAVAKAVREYVLRAKARGFGRLIREGAFDYPEPQAAEEKLNPVPPLKHGGPG